MKHPLTDEFEDLRAVAAGFAVAFFLELLYDVYIQHSLLPSNVASLGMVESTAFIIIVFLAVFIALMVNDAANALGFIIAFFSAVTAENLVSGLVNQVMPAVDWFGVLFVLVAATMGATVAKTEEHYFG